MFRNSAAMVFVLFLSAPLFSQDQAIRVTRDNDLIVVVGSFQIPTWIAVENEIAAACKSSRQLMGTLKEWVLPGNIS